MDRPRVKRIWRGGLGLVLVFNALALVLLAARPAQGQVIDGLGDLSRLGYSVTVDADRYRLRKAGGCFGALALDWEFAALVCPPGAQVDEDAQRVLLRQVAYRNLVNVIRGEVWGIRVFGVYADHGLLAGGDALGE